MGFFFGIIFIVSIFYILWVFTGGKLITNILLFISIIVLVVISSNLLKLIYIVLFVLWRYKQIEKMQTNMAEEKDVKIYKIMTGFFLVMIGGLFIDSETVISLCMTMLGLELVMGIMSLLLKTFIKK